MYSSQDTKMSQITMKRHMYHVSRGEDDAPTSNDRSSSFVRTWNQVIGFSENCFQNLWPANNQLSVTVVNDQILTLENSSTKDPYLLQKEKFLFSDLKQAYSKNDMDFMFSTFERTPETDLEDWHIVDDSNSIKIRNDVNLIKNCDDTYEHNNTIESHSMLQVNEPKKIIENNMTEASGPRKREVDIHKDTDVESFLVISHSDVPAAPVDFVKENTISHFSNVCRNAWNRLANLYCKTQSARMSVKRPMYLTKQHHRRKANVIAMGRGRGRAKCQLRRSGVSQTIRRKEYIKFEDYEALQNNLDTLHIYNRLGSNNMDIPGSAQIIKPIDNPSIFSSSKASTPTKGKPKACKKKKTKAKCVTKVHYIVKSSRMNDREDNRMPDAQEDSSRLRTLSEHSADVEDDWIVFEDDDEKLPETCEKQGATEYPITARYVPSSLIKKNDSSYEDFNSETHDTKKISFQWQRGSSSESSTDSEDSRNSMVSDEQEATECPRMHDRLTKINDKQREDFNSQMQKDLFQHCRLSSESSETSETSETSDGSNISNNSDTFNSSFATEENDDVDGYDEMSINDGSQDGSIVFADENSEELTAQTKKVSFDPTPVLHVMVKWNYAYRAARKGPWEEIARDNERFRGRINSIAIVLDPILKSTHRSQVWQERFSFSE